MTAAATSIATYHDDSFQYGAGLLRKRIADHVRFRGPMTGREIAADLQLETGTVSGRLRELIVAGDLVELADPRPCPITKRVVRWVTHKDNVCAQRGLPL
jgi:DNA-binding MarR family transcriptional regulator